MLLTKSKIILYGNTYSSPVSDVDIEDPFFWCRVKNSLPIIFNFSQFHEHIPSKKTRRCEPQQIFNETFLLLCPNNFSPQHVISETHIHWYIKSSTCLFIYLSPSIVFPMNFLKIRPIKLKIGMLYHMNNIFETSFFRYLLLCL